MCAYRFTIQNHHLCIIQYSMLIVVEVRNISFNALAYMWFEILAHVLTSYGRDFKAFNVLTRTTDIELR